MESCEPSDNLLNLITQGFRRLDIPIIKSMYGTRFQKYTSGPRPVYLTKNLMGTLILGELQKIIISIS